MMDADERTAWLALAAADGVGETTFWTLIARHGSAAGALASIRPDRDVRDEANRRLPKHTQASLRIAASDPTAIIRRLEELGVWTSVPHEPDYPRRLDVLDPKPAVLYGWGARGALDAPRAVAVVGTRRPTLIGRSFASQVGARLAEVGAVVISGLAIGIDGAAHAAAVAAGGVSVAVIGAGHDQPGPRAHRSLVRAILDGGGAVVSELAPDSRASRGTFPRRNRLISALGEDATIVIEAPRRSGALITARHALEQGRPLLVAPGRPRDPHAAGCLALLRETPARPLVGLDEMIVDLGWDGPTAGGRAPAPGHVATRLSLDAALAMLGPAERSVAARLARGPVGVDSLGEDTDLSPAVVSGAVMLLMLRGWAQAVGPVYLPAGPLLTADHRT